MTLMQGPSIAVRIFAIGTTTFLDIRLQSCHW